MSNFHGEILRRWIFPYSYKLRGMDFTGTMEEALQNQRLDKDTIRALQFKKLKSLLQHAYSTVPFYKKQFNTAGIIPEDVKSFEDFSKIPSITKEQIRQNPESFLSTDPRSKAVDVSTSGATGSPLKFHLSKCAIISNLVSHYRILQWWGIELGDPHIMLWGYGYNPRKAPGFRKALQVLFTRPIEDLIMNRRTMAAFNISKNDLKKDVAILQKFKPKYIFTYPSALSFLADFIRDQGINGHNLEIQLILSFGEILYDQQTELFHNVFGCPTVNGYGASEVGAIAGSLPCGQIHTMDDFILVEVVKEHPSDEFGEIVVTLLENFASPLIRYNLQDLAVPGDGNHECPLGVGFSTLKQIIGRHHDKILLADGTYVHGTVFTSAMNKIEHVKHFQVIQKQPDLFDILVVTDSEKDLPKIEKKVKARLRKRAGIKHANVIRVPAIPAETTGKFRFVRSEVN